MIIVFQFKINFYEFVLNYYWICSMKIISIYFYGNMALTLKLFRYDH